VLKLKNTEEKNERTLPLRDKLYTFQRYYNKLRNRIRTHFPKYRRCRLESSRKDRLIRRQQFSKESFAAYFLFRAGSLNIIIRFIMKKREIRIQIAQFLNSIKWN